MIEYRYGTDDYLITLEYRGKDLKYRMYCYDSNPNKRSWFICSKRQMQELSWDIKTRTLNQVLLHGQPPLPADFMELLQVEFRKAF